MSQVTDNNKRIAKNTLLLYVRMLFMMIVSLYTSRVILNALGVEDFGIYNDLKDQNDIIFSGSTKLPGNGPKTLFEVANYWLKCLTEITHLLTNATWNVTFDDVDLIFDLDEGWRFPTDEEYKKQKSN